MGLGRQSARAAPLSAPGPASLRLLPDRPLGLSYLQSTRWGHMFQLPVTAPPRVAQVCPPCGPQLCLQGRGLCWLWLLPRPPRSSHGLAQPRLAGGGIPLERMPLILPPVLRGSHQCPRGAVRGWIPHIAQDPGRAGARAGPKLGIWLSCN